MEKIKPTPKVSVQVVIYCDFSHIFNILLVFSDNGRIFAGIRFYYILMKFYMGLFCALTKKTRHTHIAYLCRYEFGVLYVFSVFLHVKSRTLTEKRRLKVMSQVAENFIWFFSHVSTPFLPYPPSNLKKKSKTAHPNVY